MRCRAVSNILRYQRFLTRIAQQKAPNKKTPVKRHQMRAAKQELPSKMEQREHPRIQLPLVVDITHPVLGTVRCTANDISGGGVFVELQDKRISVGAKFKIQIVSIDSVDTRTTPTVDVSVVRIEDNGMGLEFANRTAAHLWQSVDRLRDELQIGRDYFQIHQSIALVHAEKGVLLIQQSGKWLLPGLYLHVGEANLPTLQAYVSSQLGLNIEGDITPLSVSSNANVSVPEAATFAISYTAPTQTDKVKIAKGSSIKDWRWVNTERDVLEITFAAEAQRDSTLNLVAQITQSS